MERRVFESTDEREAMRVIPCEQGSDEWFMHRKGIPTASCFSKIVQPQLESKTIKNKNKKLPMALNLQFTSDGITFKTGKSYDDVADVAFRKGKENKVITDNSELKTDKDLLCLIQAGSSVLAQGGFKQSASSKGYICLLIAESKFKAPAQWIDCLAAVRHGTETEPEARRVYEWNNDKKVEQVGFCVTDNGHFGCRFKYSSFHSAISLSVILMPIN